MSYIAKVLVAGTLSAGAIGGASYAGYRHFTKVSFSDKLGVSVLNLTGTDNQKEGGLRLAELKLKKTGLDETLSKLKKEKGEEVRDGCNSNSSNRFNEEADTIYKNFEEFCTGKVGDKLSEKIEATVGNTQEAGKTAHKALKQVTNKNTLSSELQKVYEEKDTSNADRKAMHDWCTANYKKTGLGEDNSIFKETKTYCKTTG